MLHGGSVSVLNQGAGAVDSFGRSLPQRVELLRAQIVVEQLIFKLLCS